MKRAMIIAVVASLLAPGFAAAGPAREGRQEARREAREQRREERQAQRREEWRDEDRRAQDPRNTGPRYEPRPDVRRYQDPRNEPPPFIGGRGSWGRGQYLPPMYRGGVVRDPGRFRLRTPPPGYDWVGVGPDIYLVQRSTGLVLDAIPGGF